MNNRKPITFQIRPYDARCRYWAKLVRAGSILPMPGTVQGAHSIPGSYLKHGQVELRAGDILFEGEAKHPRNSYGWVYWVHVVDENLNLQTRKDNWGEFKMALKEASGAFDADLLKGTGSLAACVRFAHIHRLGGLERLRALNMAQDARAVFARVASGARVAMHPC